MYTQLGNSKNRNKFLLSCLYSSTHRYLTKLLYIHMYIADTHRYTYLNKCDQYKTRGMTGWNANIAPLRRGVMTFYFSG